ncbi:TPA: hypothetical protein ACH3X1_006177 [Trebouxia sp. C0004]
MAARGAKHFCHSPEQQPQTQPGDIAFLPLAEEALRKVHRCSIMVNDLHPENIVLVANGNLPRVFFVDFSHSTPSPSLAQCGEELCSLRAVFSLKIQ